MSTFVFIGAVICLSAFSDLAEGYLDISDDEYSIMPRIYEMVDYQECINSHSIYCNVDIKLKPQKNYTTWKIIEKTKKDKLSFNHDEIYRTMCMPKVFRNDLKGATAFISNQVNKQLEGIHLNSTVEKITYKDNYYPTRLEAFIWNILIAYSSLILTVTMYDYVATGKDTGDRVLLAFSLKRNLKKLFDTNKNPDYQNLKSIQGIRTITCIFVICTHTFLSVLFSFVDNTKIIEEVFHLEYIVMNYTFTLFLTQTFSLFSAWLLTVQVFNIFEANRRFTFKDALIIFFNRVFRVWPVLISAVVYTRRAFLRKIKDAPLAEVLDSVSADCETYWLNSLLFIQNLSVNNCNKGYWFLSTDMQLYVFGLFVLYLTLKVGYTRTILGICFLLSYILFATIIYLKDLDVAYRVTPEICKWVNFRQDENFLYVYTMPYVTMGTYLVGICFGVLYHKYRQIKSKIFDVVWICSFAILPPLAIVIASRDFSGISAAIVGPLVRPMYTFGIGMGVFGMSRSSEGFIKRIFEARPLEWFAQFTYCIYVYHFIPVFLRTALHQPLNLSSFTVPIYLLKDIFLGSMIGIVLYLTVELPWSNLQKIFIPQVKKGKSGKEN